MDRQKILIILGVAWVSAALLTWFFISKTRGPKTLKTLKVMAAVRDLPLGTRLRKTDLKQVEIQEKDLPTGALLQDKEAIDRALMVPVSANETLTNTKLSSVAGADGVPSTIEAGKRAISVQISDVSGVAGLIQPNSRVDVFFTRPGTMAEATTTIILQNVKVLAIGRLYQAGQLVDPKAPKMPVATLVVTPEEAQKLELAKNQGKISLVLRNPLDQSQETDVHPVTTDSIDPLISARLARARRGRTTNLGGKVPNLDDPKVWQDLTGEKKVTDKDKEKAEEEARRKKEAEKPKLVVDVFRGDKHVQEIFR
ncbi:MAG: Flp pilus assembly protein CpaB [Acidobacteria bacterium]|nr:Flp pilus assembly protein CpaB [Acidobacteriota bacterium]MBI3469735.1 Flp pilus assembly protein CpaB [Candidatus Solibacter usitatus]